MRLKLTFLFVALYACKAGLFAQQVEWAELSLQKIEQLQTEYADKVDGLKPGLYRYIATKNAVVPVSFEEGLKDKLNDSMLNQWFGCAVALYWVFNAYRCEWRYTGHAHKVSVVDAGHIGQNCYLAAEALDMGCCTLGAYKQTAVDEALGVDSANEYCVYIGVVGKPEA